MKDTNISFKGLVATILVFSFACALVTEAQASMPSGNVTGWGEVVAFPLNAQGATFTKIAAGNARNVALKSDGTVVAWGQNSLGQCDVPSGLSGVVALSAGAGGDHTLALKGDGTVVAWGGNNFYGEATVPAGLSGVVAVAAGGAMSSLPLQGAHSLALETDGTVVAWGLNNAGQCNVPGGLSGVTAIAAGDTHSLALKSDGTVVAWGDDSHWQCDVPSGLGEVVGIAAATYHSLALKGDGTVVAWGWDFYGQCTVPSGLSGVVAIAAGTYHSLALKSDGTVVAWGFTGYGAVPSGLSGVTAIAAGINHNLALKSDGTLAAEGLNSFGQCDAPTGLGGLIGVLAIAEGGHHSLALNSDGTVVEWGYAWAGQVPIGLSGVTAIAAGSDHSLALKSDGTVLAWGWNNWQQCDVPTGLNGVTGIAASSFHSLALKNDGTVVAWGDNTYGQSTVPSGLSGVTAIAAGDVHGLALKRDGTVVMWGSGPNVPSDLSGVVAIAAGANHDLALKSDGTVVAWGWNAYGQCNVPSDLSGVVAIAAGLYHSLALKSDGTVVAWGSVVRFPNGNTEPCTVPSGLRGVVAISAQVNRSLALFRENQPPVPDVTTLSPLTGQCSVAVTMYPTATGDQGAKIKGTTTDPLTYDQQGAYTITWHYDDGHGNVPTQTQTVIVKDTTAPVPDKASLPTVTGQCSATIAAAPTATDNCAGQITGKTTDPLTYTAQGTYTVPWRYNDGNGNASSQTQTVIVKDTTAPTIACPADITVNSLGDVPDPAAEIAAGRVQAADNCSAVTITSLDTPAPATLACGGTFTRTYQASDASGNQATCGQRITILPQLGFDDEHVAVHYHDRNAPGASDANRGYSRAEIRGELHFCNPGMIPEDLLANPNASSVQVLVNARLAGKVIAQNAVTLQIKGANRRNWESPNGGAGQVDSVQVHWEDAAEFNSKTSNPNAPLIYSKFISLASSDLRYEANPGSYTTQLPNGVSIVVVNARISTVTGLLPASFEITKDMKKVDLTLPYRLVPGMAIITTGSLNDTTTVTADVNYVTAEAKFYLKLRADGLANPPLFQDGEALTYELTLGVGASEHAASGRSSINANVKPWDQSTDNHRKYRDDGDESE